jgi:predicted nucleotidyltransferase
MKTIDEIKNTINKYKTYLSDSFKVKSISVFGSYLRGEQKENSDLDILVEFNETIDLFEFIHLENYLAEILGCKVDLVMKDALKPRIKDRILSEAVNI